MHRSAGRRREPGSEDAMLDLPHLGLLAAMAAGPAMAVIAEQEPPRIGRRIDERREDRIGLARALAILRRVAAVMMARGIDAQDVHEYQACVAGDRVVRVLLPHARPLLGLVALGVREAERAHDEREDLGDRARARHVRRNADERRLQRAVAENHAYIV